MFPLLVLVLFFFFWLALKTAQRPPQASGRFCGQVLGTLGLGIPGEGHQHPVEGHCTCPQKERSVPEAVRSTQGSYTASWVLSPRSPSFAQSTDHPFLSLFTSLVLFTLNQYR